MRSLTALVGTAAAGVFLAAFHWERLPERVASHFDSSGVANGWMSRDAHFLFSIGLVLGLSTMFLAVAFMIRRVPKKWVNIPNKDHWFGPDHEEATRRYVASWALGFGAVINLYMIFVLHMVFLASRADPVAVNNRTMILGLIVFLAISVLSTVGLLRHFAKPPSS